MVIEMRAPARPRTGFLAATVVAVAAMLAMAAGVAHAQAKLKVDNLVEFFDIVVFGAELEGVQRQTIVRKWKSGKTLRYKIGCDPGSDEAVKLFSPVIERHATALGFDTGLSYQKIGGRDPGEDIIFWFAAPDRMVQAGMLLEKDTAIVRRAATGRCYFLSYNLPDGEMVKAMIVVNRANQAKDIEHCLLEEMAQSLGLPNDSPLVTPSLFNDREQPMELTRVDRFLLRTLYDTRMPMGGQRNIALAAARSIMTDIGRKSGWAE
jgi:hypothetical protein